VPHPRVNVRGRPEGAVQLLRQSAEGRLQGRVGPPARQVAQRVVQRRQRQVRLHRVVRGGERLLRVAGDGAHQAANFLRRPRGRRRLQPAVDRRGGGARVLARGGRVCGGPLHRLPQPVEGGRRLRVRGEQPHPRGVPGVRRGVPPPLAGRLGLLPPAAQVVVTGEAVVLRELRPDVALPPVLQQPHPRPRRRPLPPPPPPPLPHPPPLPPP